MITAIAAEVAYSISVVFPLLFNVVCTDIVTLLSDHEPVKRLLGAIHPVEKKGSDRLVYDAAKEG